MPALLVYTAWTVACTGTEVGCKAPSAAVVILKAWVQG